MVIYPKGTTSKYYDRPIAATSRIVLARSQRISATPTQQVADRP
ncbi:hypothetical protein [Microcoleus sp.]